MWINDLFGVKKPIITMLHLDPLPGDPRYRYGDCMDRVVEHARADLRALQDGGVDGVMFSNEFSLPYERHMSFVTPAAMEGRKTDENQKTDFGEEGFFRTAGWIDAMLDSFFTEHVPLAISGIPALNFDPELRSRLLRHLTDRCSKNGLPLVILP